MNVLLIYNIYVIHENEKKRTHETACVKNRIKGEFYNTR